MQEEQNQIQDCIVEASHPKKNIDDAFQKSEKQPTNEIEKVVILHVHALGWNVSNTKAPKAIKTKKAASKPEKPASSKDKTKKNKKA